MKRRDFFPVVAGALVAPCLPVLAKSEPRERGLGIPWDRNCHIDRVLGFLCEDARSELFPGQKFEIRATHRLEKIGWYWRKDIQEKPLISICDGAALTGVWWNVTPDGPVAAGYKWDNEMGCWILGRVRA